QQARKHRTCPRRRLSACAANGRSGLILEMLVRSSVGTEAMNPSARGTKCACLTLGKLTPLLLTIEVSPGIGAPSMFRVSGKTLRYGSNLRPYSILPPSG